ncbi:MAG: diaminopimelate decarboxylase, partial [Firmicutes bacterium]|nr:diaminopimelate decarboxylase [Bacillota bacterium]
IQVSSKGHLTIGGCDAVALAKRYGTPLYVIDEMAIRDACRAHRREFESRYPRVRILYASKALMTKAIAMMAVGEGLALDVCSGGELYTALSAGCPPGSIYFHGNSKTLGEIDFALSAGICRFIVDNMDELRLINVLAKAKRTVAEVILRLTPGIEAHTHEYVKTGQIDSKFGIVIPNGDALNAVRHIKELKNVKLTGLHCHVGSQIFEVEPFLHAIEVMMDFARQAFDATGFIMEELDIGGGLGVRYNDGDDPLTVAELAEAIAPALLRAAEERRLPPPTLLMEPGRAIVCEAGTTLYTVNAVKHIEGVRTYVSVDGGMADNPRVALYQAEYDAILANKADQPLAGEVSIAGNCCESGDMLVWNVSLPRVEVGDTVAILCTGAYNYSMASNYNRHLRPAMVLARDGRSDLIVERETYQDLVCKDVVPERFMAACRQAAAGAESALAPSPPTGFGSKRV